MSTYSIKDMENLTGVKAHTIRIWEQRYKIIDPKRTSTNIRYYDSEDLKLMLNISLLNNNGYKISKIAELSKQEISEKVLQTIDSNNNYNDQIAALTVAMIDLNEPQFEKIISTNILQIGFEDTMINIIYPFLIRIGFLWQTNSINPAQEHFMTYLIRQKIVVAIDGHYKTPAENAKSVMLFLPEGELHEISLLFTWYLAKSRGFKVYYLGQSMPLDSVKLAYDSHKPDFVCTIITSTPEYERVPAYLKQMSERFKEADVIVSGYQVIGQDLEESDNLHIMPNVRAFIDLLDQEKVAVDVITDAPALGINANVRLR
jgi:DNA-binding transcriptional MerR regulator